MAGYVVIRGPRLLNLASELQLLSQTLFYYIFHDAKRGI